MKSYIMRNRKVILFSFFFGMFWYDAHNTYYWY